MIQMALSIATGLSHLHIEIIGTQVSLLFFCKKIIPDPYPDFFCESGSRLRPRIFFISERYKKLQLQSSYNFSQASLKGL
jgi:hypothetical protein